MEQWFLGTIGFSYRDWVGPFYPIGISQRGYLSYYCKVFNAVELNTTFYSIPSHATVQSWANILPNNFRFCLKTPRRITHELGLKDSHELMAKFINSLYPLGEKLGPILIQLPPKYTQENYSVLKEFFESIPHTVQYAIEFRHASWYNDKTARLLSQYQICWVSSEFPKLPEQINPTSDFLYIRWIGENGMYHHHTHERVDKTDKLQWWLDAIHSKTEDIKMVYGFFNNDYSGFAAGTCIRFLIIADLLKDKRNIPVQDRFF
jgi:uncharacterized protein YecE (DUF72 family)